MGQQPREARRAATAKETALQILPRGVPLPEPMYRDEESELWRRHCRGDGEATRRLVLGTMRLVLKIALEYKDKTQQPVADLVQEGALGVLRALETYDPQHGTRFQSYAAFWIRAYVMDFVARHARMVRLDTTRTRRKLYAGMGKARALLSAVDGAEPTRGQLAAAMDVPERDVEEMQALLSAPEAPLDDLRVRALAAPGELADESIERHQVRAVVASAVRSFERGLDPREKDILRGRVLSDVPKALGSLARTYGLSRERVRQIDERLRRALADHLRSRPGLEHLRDVRARRGSQNRPPRARPEARA